ncbi:hypothetical protein [Cohnella sp. WQ 127256]|uniref:hypothetical protein n=1 Tax=Cohnella sp. WQ 127256 TaxID=2938790 RepID=UPI002119A0B6|nr:hypothetical protein [Cohnella sp. WQ 127256]
MRKRLTLMLLTGVLGASMIVAGCSSNNNNNIEQSATAASDATASKLAIEMDQSSLSVVTWKMDNSHVVPVKGKVLFDGKPVVGAEVGITGKRILTTDENGAFEILVDRSLPQSLPIQINNVEKATIEGKALGKVSNDALESSVSRVDIFYPIQVTEVKTDADNPNQVEVHARALLEVEDSFPQTTLDKYMIKGTVKDASEAPVKGAIVSFTRDNGEGWSKSEPTNDQGEYMLYYSPEDDEDLYLQVHIGEVGYQLPEGRVYRFPDETSVNTDIILPATGNIIIDHPPTLVSSAAKGALYWSRAIGVSVDPSVPYSISMPKEDGSFVLIMDKAEWDKAPQFYQTEIRQLSDTEIKAGDFIPSSKIPAPKKSDPAGIVPQTA